MAENWIDDCSKKEKSKREKPKSWFIKDEKGDLKRDFSFGEKYIKYCPVENYNSFQEGQFLYRKRNKNLDKLKQNVNANRNQIQPSEIWFMEKGDGLSVNWSQFSTPNFALNKNINSFMKKNSSQYNLLEINILNLKKLIDQHKKAAKERGTEISNMGMITIRHDPTEEGLLMDRKKKSYIPIEETEGYRYLNIEGEISHIKSNEIQRDTKILDKSHSLITSAIEYRMRKFYWYQKRIYQMARLEMVSDELKEEIIRYHR